MRREFDVVVRVRMDGETDYPMTDADLKRRAVEDLRWFLDKSSIVGSAGHVTFKVRASTARKVRRPA